MALAEKRLSPSELIEIVFERVNDHDLDGMISLAGEDLVEHWPVFGRLEGRTAVREAFASVFAAFPDVRVEPERMVSQGNAVFVHWRMTGTFTGTAYNGIAATGEPIDVNGTDYFTVRDGKIVSVFVAYDGMDLAVQIGLLPAPGTRRYQAAMTAMNALTAVRRRLRRSALGQPS